MEICTKSVFNHLTYSLLAWSSDSLSPSPLSLYFLFWIFELKVMEVVGGI